MEISQYGQDYDVEHDVREIEVALKEGIKEKVKELKDRGLQIYRKAWLYD